MRNWLLAWMTTSLLACAQTFGADISYIDYEPFTQQKIGEPGMLLLSGEIVPGDYGRLLAKIRFSQGDFFVLNTIILASDGGDVREAIKIAKLVKSLYSEVLVGPATGRCVSACFLIFAAANERSSDDERLVGIHRPYVVDQQLASMSPAEAEREQNKVLAQAREYLKDNNVPGYLIEEMFRRSSRDVYWLSADDLTQLGYQSPWFNQYLVAKCNWKGNMPFGLEEKRPDVAQCRDRVTKSAGMDALGKAVSEYVARYGPLPGAEAFAPPPPTEEDMRASERAMQACKGTSNATELMQCVYRKEAESGCPGTPEEHRKCVARVTAETACMGKSGAEYIQCIQRVPR
jgi:hypothetical protein